LAACVAAAVAMAAVTLPVRAAEAAAHEQWQASTASHEFNEQDTPLVIECAGPIVPGMAESFRAAIDRYGAFSRRQRQFLGSAGDLVVAKAGIITRPLETWAQRLAPPRRVERAT